MRSRNRFLGLLSPTFCPFPFGSSPQSTTTAVAAATDFAAVDPSASQNSCLKPKMDQHDGARRENCGCQLCFAGRINKSLRFLTFFKVALGRTTLDDVGDGRLMVEDLHDLAARIVDALRDDLAALHVALRRKRTI